jgi:hypothetical protein
MPHSYVLTIFVIAILAGTVSAADPPCVKDAPKVGTKLPLVFCDDFQSGSSENWVPGDSNAWKMTKLDDNFVFE